jgi:hypothetical protein
MIFLLPSEPFDHKKVDYSFMKEYNSIITLGYNVSLFDHDRFVTNGEFVSNFDFKKKSQSVVLRSWMLNIEQYHNLWTILKEKGFNIINNPTEYSNCHHLPEYYKWVERLTPKAVWTDDLSDESLIDLRSKIQGDVILKDYVKSEKDCEDIFILKKEITNEELIQKLSKFRNQRGKLFNEGIVFKEKAALKKYGDKTNEWRIFFLQNKIISISQNSNLGWGQCPEVSFLLEFSEKIESNFFSIDIAEMEDSSWNILECGDGGVSGLSPDQNELIFYMNFMDFDKSEKL